MTASTAESADQYSTRALVRRLLVDEALTHWPRYAFAFVLMAIAAAATALSAYLLGTMINETYVDRNLSMVVAIGLAAMVMFTAKGSATYGATVTLSRIGNSIIADNQKRMVRQAPATKHRLFRRSPFVGIHRPAHHRRRRRQPGDQSSHHGHRPRSDVVDWAVHRHGYPGSDNVGCGIHYRAASSSRFPLPRCMPCRAR
jgi:hypothetical protein